MLFNNILSISLLALRAGFSVAKPISGHERREAAIAEQGAKLLPREDKFTESGTITGTAADTLRTYSLATCPGLAASGSADPQGDGTNKVLAHIQCSPDGSTPHHFSPIRGRPVALGHVDDPSRWYDHRGRGSCDVESQEGSWAVDN